MNKPFVYNYTVLNTYLICPLQMNVRYVTKQTKFVQTPEMQYGDQVHKAMEFRISGGKPLPPTMSQWEPFAAPLAAAKASAEKKLAVTRDGRPTGFFDDNVFFRGKADTTVIAGTSAFLADFKTGKRREDSFELECQAMMLHAANPYLTSIKGAYVWLKDNQMGVEHDCTDTGSTWARVNNIVEEIEDCMRHDEWEATKSPLCGWCDYFTCKHNTNPKKP